MKLVIVRHGDAVDASEDPARPLSEAGNENAACLAAFLSPRVASIGEIWHSTKLRAQQTAEVIRTGALTQAAILSRDDMAPNDDPQRVIGMLNSRTESLCIVGHAPWVGVLSARLVTQRPVHDMWRFPTCGALCLESDRPNHWWVQWFISPELLRNGANDLAKRESPEF